MRKFLVIISTLVGVLLLGTLVYDIARLNTNKSSFRSDNPIIATYDSYEALAKDSLKVYKIYDEESYQSAKDKLKSSMSPELVKTYFSTDNYVGYEMQPQKLTINDVKGDITNLESDSSIVFKLEVGYDSGNAYQDATILVTIRNGIIISIERI